MAVLSWHDERPRVLHFGPSALLASAVHSDGAGRLSTGNDAVRAGRSNPSGFEPHPKRRIDDGEVLLGASTHPVAELIAATLSTVRVEAERVSNGPIDELVMTIPAGWATPRRSVLAEAASLAELPEPTFVPEPVAAASYFATRAQAPIPDGGTAVVYDLGAGTFDVTVVRRTGTDFEVLAVNGLDDLGGIDLDQVLIELIGASLNHERRDVWRRLLAPADATAMRARHELWRDVRDAREALSRQPNADIYLPLVDHQVHINREEFEQHAAVVLGPTITTMMRAVGDSGIPPADLAGVLLVGGASRTPLIATLVHRAVTIAPTTVEQPELVVADGGLCAAPIDQPSATAPPRPTDSRPERPRVPLPSEVARIIGSVMQEEVALATEQGRGPGLSAAVSLLARIDPTAAIDRLLSMEDVYSFSNVFDVLSGDVSAITDALDQVPEDHPLRHIALFEAAEALATTAPETAANLFDRCDRMLRATPTPSRQTRVALLRSAALWSAASDDASERRLTAVTPPHQRDRYLALCQAIRPLAAADPQRALRTLPIAVNGTGDEELSVGILVRYVGVVDVERAGGLVARATRPDGRCEVLLLIAALTEDSAHARGLLSEVERLIPQLPQGYRRDLVFRKVVNAWATVDPERAEYLLASPLDGDPFNSWVLAELAVELAKVDIERAVQLHRMLPDEYAEMAVSLAEALLEVDVQAAERVAHTIPGRFDLWEYRIADLVEQFAEVDLPAAERLTGRLPADDTEADDARLALARQWAGIAPDRAEHWARAIVSPYDECAAVCALAATAAGYTRSSPKRARRLLKEATELAAGLSGRDEIDGLIALGTAAAGLDPAEAARTLAKAEPMVRAVDHRASHNAYTRDLAHAWMTVDRERSERLLRSLKDDPLRTRHLLFIAEEAARKHGITVRPAGPRR
ncbi:Hsp70 protein [Stackebrandtia endophytica]|uniref:Hsp70 protein n=1 Tax=Stackebrandtia endophytica TaxID=1496996 RepID=A0A543AQ89_9ACTN|nr:Hsp70 protein [Stackebrandtia endophytica]